MRRIDDDWLWAGAQRLALKMDSYTNNTCLVLAFELPKSKQVLLFPADAQVGQLALLARSEVRAPRTGASFPPPISSPRRASTKSAITAATTPRSRSRASSS